MRVWDIPVELLCWTHLNGQHREIHGIMGSIIKYYSNGNKGYSNHPETKRWIGHENQLIEIHELTSQEMIKRGRNHKSPIKLICVEQDTHPLSLVDDIESQINNLYDKSINPNHKCDCNIVLINDWFIKTKQLRRFEYVEI